VAAAGNADGNRAAAPGDGDNDLPHRALSSALVLSGFLLAVFDPCGSSCDLDDRSSLYHEPDGDWDRGSMEVAANPALKLVLVLVGGLKLLPVKANT
jgi:hypothetical protein